MHEIKFRAKATENAKGILVDYYRIGDWVYGHYYYCRQRSTGIIVAVFSVESGGVVSGFVQTEIEVNSETVGMFIGLKDKNKKDICEGDEIKFDLLKRSAKEPLLKNEIGVIKCENLGEINVGVWRWKYINKDSIEVIDNTDKNPELLEKTNG